MGGPLHSFPGMSCVIVALRPAAIGYCRIKSADPRVYPSILHNFLETIEAQQVAVDALKLARKITAGPALARFGPTDFSGTNTVTDGELLSYARETVTTIFHQSGTCKMGEPTIAWPSWMRGCACEVRKFLRVVDASIMPKLVSGNTNAPVMMIGEKAAAIIKADRRSGAVSGVA